MQKPSEILTAAKLLIIDPTRWTCGTYGRDEGGGPLDPEYMAEYPEKVCQMCAWGALVVAMRSSNFMGSEARKFLDEAAAMQKLTSPGGIPLCTAPQLNDNSEHGEVLRMFDDAIKLARAAGK